MNTDKEERQWGEIRREIKELKENSNADSYGWIILLQEVLNNKPKLRKNVKHAMAFTAINDFQKIQGKPEKFFAEIYYRLSPYTYGKDGFFYGKLQAIANGKMNNSNTIQKKLITQRKLPWISPAVSSR